jgi:Aromatic acid exporter family member 1
MIRIPFRPDTSASVVNPDLPDSHLPDSHLPDSHLPERVSEQLMLARRRAQPKAVYIVRLTVTAVFAYGIALMLTGSSRPVLAPLTALLVLQATLYQTIRMAAEKVLGVTAGVLAAVGVAAYVPFSWWVLGLLIAATLALGMALRLGDNILEVPISAMLIFSVDTHAAATSRIADTLIGVGAGLAAGLLFAPLRVQPAKEAVGELTERMSSLLGEMSAGLAEVPAQRRAAEWLDGARALRGEVSRLDEALGQAEESIRLNPRRLLTPNAAAGLREGVDSLERAATDMRVLARSVADSTRIDSDDSPVRDPEARARLAAVLGELSAAVRAYGQLVESEDAGPADTGLAEHRVLPSRKALAGRQALASRQAMADRGGAGNPGLAVLAAARPEAAAELREHLSEAHRRQDQLADALRTDPDERPDGWPLRGEILAHVDRLRNELDPERERTQPMRTIRSRRRPRIRLPRQIHRP